MNIIFILMVILMFFVAIFDIETATIPHTVTILLLALGIVSCFIDKNIDLWLCIGTTCAVFALLFITFIALGDSAIGGGDVKIMTISMLFLHNVNNNYCYIMFLGFFSLFGVIYAKISKEKTVKYGPYMAISLISTYLYSYNNEISNVIYFDIIFLFFLYMTHVIYKCERSDYPNVF